MDLRKQLEGVNQDSPPVDQEPASMPDVEPKGDDKGKDQDGRSLDNVRGEILRKFDKLVDKIERLEDQVTKQQSTPAAPQKSSQSDSLDGYSVAELENYRGQVPEENRAAFDSYLIDRKVREQIDTRLSVFTQAQETQQERDRHNKIALSRYPDLGDLTSEFAREVNARIKAIPDQQIENNPRIVLDIANDVAIEKDIKPTSRRVIRGRTAATDTEPAPQKEDQPILTDEERAALAKRLKGALPRGKDFDLDRIKKREQAYSDGELDLHIKKG